MFTWEEAGLLRIMLLVLKWAAIVLVAAGSLAAATALAGCPARGRVNVPAASAHAHMAPSLAYNARSRLHRLMD